MSDYRSFGSNFHQSSQSRKISIGVMADSKPKSNPGPDKGNGDVIARVEKMKSGEVTELQANKKEKGVLPVKERNAAKDTEHATSPWRSPKSSYRKLGTLENVLRKETSSLSGIKGLNKGLNGAAHQKPARDSFQNIPVLSPQRSDGELNGGRNDEGMDRNPERMEETPSAVLLQKVVGSHREEMGKPEKEKSGTTVALRSKLFEILGKASPANNEDVNSETQDLAKTKLSQDKGSNDDPLIKPRHNSDSIETGSESPENATRRPVTKSLLQRKLGANKGVQKKTIAGAQKKTTAGANLARKTTEKVTNIFSFEEGLREKTDTAMNSSGMPKKQRGRRKNTVVQCRKVQREETSKSKTPPHPVRTETSKRSSFSDKRRSSHELRPQSKARKQKPDVSTREEEEDIHPSPEAETAANPEMFHGLSKRGDKQERSSNVFREKSPEPENEFQSPTFGNRTSSSQQSSPEASPLHPRNISPALDETEAPIFSFGTKKISQVTRGKVSDTKRRLHESLKKKGVSSFRKESSDEPNEDIAMSEPSSDEKSSDGSGDGSSALDDYNSPEERETANWSHEKSKRASSSAKRNSNLKGSGRVVLSPTTSLSKGIDKTNSFKRFLKMDEDEDEGSGRDAALFTLALKDFEKKLKSAAKKKASDIIASVSEEIYQELENIKSKIMTETGKTINLAKTKRKHAETRLQEQQEKMKMIHEKFNEDVGHQLEDFKSNIEGLEANHSEMKRTIKKQRTSYQKLIAQFEGGIEKKLDNATKKVDSVNKSARGKLVQMKKIMAECLKDDVLE